MLAFTDHTLAEEGRADARMNFRTKSRIKETIQKAAALSGVDDSTFAMSAAYSHALEVINSHERTTLAAQDFDAFFDALDNPPAPTDALKNAFKAHEAALKS